MHSSPHADYNDLLLSLYRLSSELPIEHFQDAALNLIKPVVRFDSSMWGSAILTPTGIDVQSIHLHNQPVDMLVAYEDIKHLDTAAQESGRRPASTMAFDANAWFSRKDQAVLRDHGKRFDQAHFFISSTFDPRNRFTRWLTLFRASSNDPCTADECQALAVLTPHIQQALELNRLSHAPQLRASGDAAQGGSAISDTSGVLRYMDPVFEHAIHSEWENWRRYMLPADLLRAFSAGQTRFMGRSQVISLHTDNQLLFLTTRPRFAADNLAPRELTVARLLARGNTHKHIAALLQRSPDTVRSQIRSIYDKLSVNNVAGLIEELRRAE